MHAAADVHDAVWFESGAHRERYSLVRVASRKAVRATARALRPVLGERAFEQLYALGRMGYLPRLAAPRTIAEKLLWLRRHYRDPRMPRLADKLAMRDYVAEVAPECRTPEVYTVSDSADTFDFAALPERAVIKATHGSGFVAFWRQGADRAALRARMARWLETPYARHANEWVYADLAPRLFAEADLSDERGHPPPDYKLFTYAGHVAFVSVLGGRGERLFARFFDRDWRQLPAFRRDVPGGPPVPPVGAPPPRPPQLAALIDAAERLGRPFPFVRVDAYLHDDRVYVGELTFFPASGHTEFFPPAFEYTLAEPLVLPGPDSPYLRRTR